MSETRTWLRYIQYFQSYLFYSGLHRFSDRAYMHIVSWFKGHVLQKREAVRPHAAIAGYSWRRSDSWKNLRTSHTLELCSGFTGGPAAKLIRDEIDMTFSFWCSLSAASALALWWSVLLFFHICVDVEVMMWAARNWRMSNFNIISIFSPFIPKKGKLVRIPVVLLCVLVVCYVVARQLL